MSNLTIFNNQDVAVSTGVRERTALGQALASNSTFRRIQTTTSGVFRRMINGEVNGTVRGEIDVIVVGALPKVSRVFYKGAYDPKAEATLPDCWSNLGDKPEPEASNKQAARCDICPQNVKGSGDNGGRACRFQRRLAILLAGDESGDVYQFNVPAKSLFGKGVGNVHPFESYKNFLIANGHDPDTVVTNISYDPNAESMQLLFSPTRTLTDDEYELVLKAQAGNDVDRYIKLTVAQADGVSKKPKDAALAAPAEEEAPPTKAKAKAKMAFSDEPEDEEEAAPMTKRAGSKKAAVEQVGDTKLAEIINAWGDE